MVIDFQNEFFEVGDADFQDMAEGENKMSLLPFFGGILVFQSQN
jgi:hypothetical protein